METKEEISNEQKVLIREKYLNACRVIVAGGRDFDDYALLSQKLDNLLETSDELENEDMLSIATHLVAFWDGKSNGTGHIIEKAKEMGIPVWVYNYKMGAESLCEI